MLKKGLIIAVSIMISVVLFGSIGIQQNARNDSQEVVKGQDKAKIVCELDDLIDFYIDDTVVLETGDRRIALTIITNENSFELGLSKIIINDIGLRNRGKIMWYKTDEALTIRLTSQLKHIKKKKPEGNGGTKSIILVPAEGE